MSCLHLYSIGDRKFSILCSNQKNRLSHFVVINQSIYGNNNNNSIKTCALNNFLCSIWIQFHEFHKSLTQLAVVER